VQELRDEAIHLFISEVPKDVLGILQACVINYHRCLNDWFEVILSDRVPVGMMSIVFDVSPERLDLSSAVMRRRLGKDAADYLLSLSEELRAEHADLGRSAEFSVEFRYGLAIEKDAEGAAVVAITGDEGAAARIDRSARDPGDLFPWRQKELVPELNRRLKSPKPLTIGDVQAVIAANKIKRRPDMFFQSKAKGSPPLYGPVFAQWFEDRYRSDPEFLNVARSKYRQMMVRARDARQRRARRELDR
jgi:hypothetical protein